MVSEFLTVIRRLRVFNSISNHQLLEDKNQSLDENQNPCCSYIKLFEYNKDNYQDEDKMTN